jgi:ABC-type nitrate/sulfonate/bicarbonate transport system substrate-binding protein
MRQTLRAMLAALCFTLILAPSVSCSPRWPSDSAETITVAWSPFESTALLWVADKQGFFARNRLSVALRRYDTGAGSLNAVLNGEADIAFGPSEFPVVGQAFDKPDMRITAIVDRAEFIYIISRKDLGIENASDLRGKRVGTTFGTAAQFFLGRYLELNGISTNDVTLVDLRTPDEWVSAVAEGKVDAVATSQPYAYLARERLGSNAVVFRAQSGQQMYGLVVSSKSWVTAHSETAKRFMKSLSMAEDYLLRRPDDARATVEECLDLKPEYVEEFWEQNVFSLSLDDSLVVAMEDQARWMIKNNLTTETRVPDFHDFIYEDALKAVKPKAVDIIR